MAMYVDEDEAWKCLKHPSRRRRTGICPTCLRERLGSLCPDCANLRPCGCAASSTATTSSSSSASSSFSKFFSRGGSVHRVSNLADSEPSLRKSRSVAVSLFRSRSRYASDLDSGSNRDSNSPGGKRGKTASFWGIFSRERSVRSGRRTDESVSLNGDQSCRKTEDERAAEEERKTMMRKSRSVAVTSNRKGDDVSSAAGGKGKRSWYLPSPIKAFRQPKVSKAAVAQDWNARHYTEVEANF